MQIKLKRLIDIIFSIVGLIIFFPLLLVIAFCIRIDLGSPIFFRQKRVGLNGEVFEMIKFRTMKDLYGVNGELLPNSKRITKFGSFLRKTSLDELPELINVFKGDMSLVGPRPLLVEYLTIYSSEQMKRHNMRPGITGYAQVNGRNGIPWLKKFELDLYYINNFNLLLDIKILLKTFYKVIAQSDINQSDEVTSEKFNGFN